MVSCNCQVCAQLRNDLAQAYARGDYRTANEIMRRLQQDHETGAASKLWKGVKVNVK
jgi:hypothetical protein